MRFTLLVLFFLGVCPLAYTAELMSLQAIEYYNEAIEAQQKGDLEQAKTLYQKAIYINPQFKQAYNNLGSVYFQLGDYQKAEEFYRKALSIDDKYEIAWKNLAFLYASRKDFDKFFEYWKKAAGLLDINTPFILADKIE